MLDVSHLSGRGGRRRLQERGFFYNPDGSLPRGIYFATIKEGDGPHDKASQLNRAGVYRLSVGLGKKAYEELFGRRPARPAKGNVIDSEVDFTTLDSLMPHPVYGWMGWVAINKPSKEQLDVVKQLLDISYHKVLTTHTKKN